MCNTSVTVFLKLRCCCCCFQLFDHCLAPDTSGDGTGCDNMTCLIVRFKPDLKRKASDESGSKAESKDEEEPSSKRPKVEDEKPEQTSEAAAASSSS